MSRQPYSKQVISKETEEKIRKQKEMTRINTMKIQRVKRDKCFVMNITPKKYNGLKYLGNYVDTFNERINFNDRRLIYLEPTLFLNKTVLDIGCGDASLSIQIAIKMFPQKLVALDIDTSMLKQAKRYIDKFLEANERYRQIATNQLILKRLKEFPLFFQQQVSKQINKNQIMLKSGLQIIPEGLQFKQEFPKNMYFLNDNFFNIDLTTKYDTVICMNVIIWIHLSFGDDGLIKLIQRIYDILKQNGHLVIEYSLNDSYKRKKSESHVFRKNMDKNINIQPQKILGLIQKMGFCLIQQIQSNPTHPLRHPIAVFRKTSIQ